MSTTIYTELLCQFCGKSCKNNNSQRNHERLCKSNPNKQSTHFQTDYNKNRTPTNHYIKAQSLGLKKPEVSDETRKKLSDANKARSKELTQSIGEKSSKTILEKARNGDWHVSLAKNMHYNYQGFDLHGTWELRLAMYMDDNKITWWRCDDIFEYEFDGRTLSYQPDFYLPKFDLYIEVKGYATEKDFAKWKQFPKDKKLVILKEYDLKELGII